LNKKVKRQTKDLDTVARYLEQAEKKLQSARKALAIDDETASALLAAIRRAVEKDNPQFKLFDGDGA
jgi:hypothetical protein